MRQDQYERLQALNEKLTDVFLEEADPAKWPGAHTPGAEMTKDQRGDRYWVKKNAFATISLVHRVSGLVTLIQNNSHTGAGGAEVGEEEASLDREVRAAEEQANELLRKLAGEGRAEFVKKTRGKA